MARMAASAALGIPALCLLLAVVNMGRLPATRTEALAVAHSVALPSYGEFGTDHAFIGKADGSGQSTRDRAHVQQLAVKQAKKAAPGHWKPLAADKLFHYKGVHFKGFNKKKAAMLHKAKQHAQTAKVQGHQKKQQKPQKLWIQPDNGVYTTINVRGMADSEGGIQYNSNFVYGAPGTQQQQPDPVSDQWWRYEDTGYKTLTGPSSGGYTPNYEMINVGPMESDGSEFGYVPSAATPVYNYFPSEFYPSSSSYNYPAAVNSAAVGKEAYIFSNGQGTGVVHQDGTVGSYHQDNSYGPGVNWDVNYDM